MSNAAAHHHHRVSPHPRHTMRPTDYTSPLNTDTAKPFQHHTLCQTVTMHRDQYACSVRFGPYGMWYGMKWYGMVWYGMVCCVMVWCGMVWYVVLWCVMVWCSLLHRPAAGWVERALCGLVSSCHVALSSLLCCCAVLCCAVLCCAVLLFVLRCESGPLRPRGAVLDGGGGAVGGERPQRTTQHRDLPFPVAHTPSLR